MKRYYTIKEVAEMFSIDHQSVRRMINNGKINAIKVGGQWRIPMTDVDMFATKELECHKLLIYSSGGNTYIHRGIWKLVRDGIIEMLAVPIMALIACYRNELGYCKFENLISHGVDYEESKSCLEKLVKDGFVVENNNDYIISEKLNIDLL